MSNNRPIQYTVTLQPCPPPNHTEGMIWLVVAKVYLGYDLVMNVVCQIIPRNMFGGGYGLDIKKSIWVSSIFAFMC